MKLCKTCNTTKTIESFAKRPGTPDGLRQQCRDCVNKKARENPNRGAWHKKNIEKVKKNNRAALLKRHYGMSLEDYNKMYTTQKGVCKICSEHDEKLVVDHCHKTGKIRGLLCNSCNLGLGAFRDSVKSLKNAIKYLEDNNG